MIEILTAEFQRGRVHHVQVDIGDAEFIDFFLQARYARKRATYGNSRRPAVLGSGNLSEVPWPWHRMKRAKRSLSFNLGSSPGICPPAGGHMRDGF